MHSLINGNTGLDRVLEKCLSLLDLIFQDFKKLIKVNLMSEIIIGVDPDLEKSGVAIKDSSSVELKNLSFPDLVELIRAKHDLIKKVVVEAGWLSKKSNFRNIQSRLVAERTAKNVGENHATGKLLVEMCKSLGVAVVEVKPTQTKVDAERFNKITGWKGRTNQEQRDACMLIWSMKV